MEKELTELFGAVKRATDVADNSPEEEDRCIGALKQLKKFPVNYQVLVSTQVGKRVRQLTKNKSDKIGVLASDVVEMWKSIIVEETMKKKNGSISNGNSVNAEPASASTRNFRGQTPLRPNKNPRLRMYVKSETSSSLKSEKTEVVQYESGEHRQVNLNVKEKASFEVRVPASDPTGLPKLTSLVYCKDSSQDKIREILAEELCKVSSDVDNELREQADICDPFRVAVLVETAIFEKWDKSKSAQKLKYRSIIFNIKDANNPDFRRKVLLGDIEPYAVLDLTAEEMASDERQIQNEKIKEKALFNSQLGGPIQASTNEFYLQ